MKPTEDAKMGNDEAERLIAAISSQIGDDVSVIFNHESLFKRSRDLLRTQAARIAELEGWKTVAESNQQIAQSWQARAEAAEAALAEAEARAYARAVEDAAIICEALNDKRLSGASGDFIASLASQRIRSLAQKEAGE